MNTLRSAVLVAVAALGLSGCGGAESPTAAAESSSVVASSATATPKASAPAPASSATSPAAAAPTTPAERRAPTAAELKSALLELDDLPAGYEIVPAEESGDDTVALASKDPRCARLAVLANAEQPSGTTAEALVSVAGGQDGPFFDEALFAMSSVRTATATMSTLRAAVAPCRSLTATVAGEGSSVVRVSQVSAPRVGDESYAFRLSAASGPLEGLEVTSVISRLGDVLLSLDFVASYPEDIEATTEFAVDKAGDVLGGGATA